MQHNHRYPEQNAHFVESVIRRYKKWTSYSSQAILNLVFDKFDCIWPWHRPWPQNVWSWSWPRPRASREVLAAYHMPAR
jgi:hypothetical protein